MNDQTAAPSNDAPDADGKFSISEDWLAFTIGLLLLAFCLTGLIPAGLIP